MGSELFIPGDEVLIRAKLKSVGGNFLVVTLTEVPDLKTTELIIFKESAVKFRCTEAKTLLNYQRFADQSSVVLQIDRYCAAAVVRQLQEDGSPTSYNWLQDLNDPGIQHTGILHEES